MAMIKRNSLILDEMHETARGLHNAGLISKRRMEEFDVLRHLNVHEMPQQNQIAEKKEKWGQTRLSVSVPWVGP